MKRTYNWVVVGKGRENGGARSDIGRDRRKVRKMNLNMQEWGLGGRDRGNL